MCILDKTVFYSNDNDFWNIEEFSSEGILIRFLKPFDGKECRIEFVNEKGHRSKLWLKEITK